MIGRLGKVINIENDSFEESKLDRTHPEMDDVAMMNRIGRGI